jgi:hypothetical protein
MHTRHTSAYRSLWFLSVLLAASGGCGLVLGLGDFKDEPSGSTNAGGNGPSSSSSTASEGGCAAQSRETCACQPMTSVACYSGPATTKNIGACKEGNQTCRADGQGYDVCTGEVLPTTEDCTNPIDDDCDGSACAAVEQKVILAGGATDPQYGDGIHMAVAPSGDVYIAGGSSASIDFGNGPLVPVGRDAFLAKYDKDLNLQWAHYYGDGVSQHADAVAVDGQGNVVIAGLISGTMDFGDGVSITKTGASAFFVAKFDPTGKALAARAIGNVPYTRCFDVAADSKGDVILSGAYAGSPGPVTLDFGGGVVVTSAGGIDVYVWDSFVAKLDASTLAGKWAKAFNDPNAEWTSFNIAVDPSDSILLAGDFGGTISFVGASRTAAGSRDAFALKLDASGNRLWLKAWGNVGKSQSIADVATDPAGNMVIVGRMDGSFDFPESGDSYASLKGGVVLKYSAPGAYVYSQFFDGSFPTAVSSDKANDILVGGSLSGAVDFGGGALAYTGGGDVFFNKREPAGKHTWSKAFGSAEVYSQISGMGMGPTGDLYVTGTISSGQLDFGDGKVGPGYFLVRLGH